MAYKGPFESEVNDLSSTDLTSEGAVVSSADILGANLDIRI